MSRFRIIYTATFILLQGLGTFAHSAQAPLVEGMDNEIAARLDNAIAKHYPANQPGAAVIVVYNGTTIFRKAYGLAANHMSKEHHSYVR